MSGGIWADEWQYAFLVEPRKDSPPPSLTDTTSDYFIAEDDNEDRLYASNRLTTKVSDASTAHSALSASAPRFAQLQSSGEGWANALMVAEPYGPATQKASSRPTSPVTNTSPSTTVIYRVQSTPSGDAWHEPHSSFLTTTTTSAAAVTARRHADGGSATSPQQLHSGCVVSPSDTNVSSTILTIHGDFAFTSRALRQLDPRGTHGSPLASAHDSGADDADALPVVRGTLVVKNHSTGYLLDWKPSFTLLPGRFHSGSMSTPPLVDAAATSRRASASPVTTSLPLSPATTSGAAARAVWAFPPRGFPAWTGDYTAAALEEAEKDASDARESSTEPPRSTAPTMTRTTTPKFSAGSRDGGLVPSLPRVAKNPSRLSPAPRKASSMPLLPTLPLTTPPSIASPAAPSPAFLKGNSRPPSDLSSESTVNIQVPPSAPKVQLRAAAKPATAPPPPAALPPRLFSTAVEAPGKSSAPQPPALPLPLDPVQLRRAAADSADAALPPSLPPPPPRPSPPVTAWRSPQASWVLLDTGSDESNRDGAALTPTRMVETATGSPGDPVIALRPLAAGLSLRPTPAVSPKCTATPPRSSNDASQELPRHNEAARRRAKKSKKAKRGHRSGSSGTSRDIPLAATAVASFYAYPGDGSTAASATHDGRPTPAFLPHDVNLSLSSSDEEDLESRVLRGRRLSGSGNGASSFFAAAAVVVPASTERATTTLSNGTSPQKLHGESLASNATVEVQPDPTPAAHGGSNHTHAAHEGNGQGHAGETADEKETSLDGSRSGRDANAPAKDKLTSSMREEAMRAFPAAPARDRFSPLGRHAARSARLHSPVAASFRNATTAALTHAETQQQKSREWNSVDGVRQEPRLPLPPPPPPLTHFAAASPLATPLNAAAASPPPPPQQKGRVARLVRAATRRMTDDSFPPLEVATPATEHRPPPGEAPHAAPLSSDGETRQPPEPQHAVADVGTQTTEAEKFSFDPPSPPARRKAKVLTEPEREEQVSVRWTVDTSTPVKPILVPTSPPRKRTLPGMEDAADGFARKVQAAKQRAGRISPERRSTLDSPASTAELESSTPGVSISHSGDLVDSRQTRTTDQTSTAHLFS